jgi:hypothetical protein
MSARYASLSSHKKTVEQSKMWLGCDTCRPVFGGCPLGTEGLKEKCGRNTGSSMSSIPRGLPGTPTSSFFPLLSHLPFSCFTNFSYPNSDSLHSEDGVYTFLRNFLNNLQVHLPLIHISIYERLSVRLQGRQLVFRTSHYHACSPRIDWESYTHYGCFSFGHMLFTCC